MSTQPVVFTLQSKNLHANMYMALIVMTLLEISLPKLGQFSNGTNTQASNMRREKGGGFLSIGKGGS